MANSRRLVFLVSSVAVTLALLGLWISLEPQTTLPPKAPPQARAPKAPDPTPAAAPTPAPRARVAQAKPGRSARAPNGQPLPLQQEGWHERREHIAYLWEQSTRKVAEDFAIDNNLDDSTTDALMDRLTEFHQDFADIRLAMEGNELSREQGRARFDEAKREIRADLRELLGEEAFTTFALQMAEVRGGGF